MTWFQLILPVGKLGQRMHVEGRQIYQMNRHIYSFQNMCDMLQAKIDCLDRKIYFVQKNTSKSCFLVDTNLSYLTLEGPGRQTVDTRSTSGVALKTLGCNASN